MNIIIVGNGKVGYTLAEYLSRQNHDVTIVDKDKNALTRATETLDVLCVRGNGGNVRSLIEAGAEKADVIIGMSRMHKLLTPRKYRSKYITLSEAATDKYSPVPDPFLATSQAEYDKTMAVLKDYVEQYFLRLKNALNRA